MNASYQATAKSRKSSTGSVLETTREGPAASSCVHNFWRSNLAEGDTE